MASDYNKTVTSRNSVNPANFSFNTGNIIGYPNKISSGSRSSSGGTTTNLTLNLDELLTDNLEEGVTSEKIADPKQYNTDDKNGFFESVGDVFAGVGGFLAVGTTSVLSGVLDIVEGIGDGVVWVASKAVGIISPDAEEAMKEFIARDLVSEANEWLYEETEFGRAINDASYMKYDSELAQGIRDVTEDVAVFAAATALTVFTGGAAAPLTIGLGAAYGLGEASESTYATYGTDTSTFQELLILGNGALSALSWYTSGKLGKGFIELGKSMAEAGVKEILAEMCKGIFSKDMLKELLKPGNLVGNAIASLMQAGGDIGLIATKLYNGGEVTPEEWALLVGELILYFGLNVAEDALRTEITNFKPRLNDNEISDMIAKLKDTTNPTKLADLIDEMDEQSFKKILSQLSPEELSKHLDGIGIDKVNKILGMLSGDELYKFIEASNSGWITRGYDGITPENIKDIVIVKVGADGKPTYNLDWPKHGGYDVGSIKSIDDLAGDVPISRSGGDGGYAMGIGQNPDGSWANSSQRSIPNSTTELQVGTFNADKYNDAADIVINGSLSDAEKLSSLEKIGFDSDQAEALLGDYKNWLKRPEVCEPGNIGEGIASAGSDVDWGKGVFGTAAPWDVGNLHMEGGAGQINTIFSWGTLKNSGIVTITDTGVIV